MTYLNNYRLTLSPLFFNLLKLDFTKHFYTTKKKKLHVAKATIESSNFESFSLENKNNKKMFSSSVQDFSKQADIINFSLDAKKMYTSYSKLSEVKLLTIGLASPLRILQWAEKTLPNGKIYGEVINANTLHHKTFKPQKGGLFCERIFGPLKDFECACGKIDKSVKQEFSKSLLTGNNSDKKEMKTSKEILDLTNPNSNLGSFKQLRKFCPDCDVEYTWSVIRRYQLGYIKLISPVTHIWFLKGTPSYLSILLDMKKRYLQYITYCSETLTLENSVSSFSNLSLGSQSLILDSPSKIFESWQNIMSKSFYKDSKNNQTSNSLKKKQNQTTQNSNPKSSLQNQLKFQKEKQKQRLLNRVVKKALPQKTWKTEQHLKSDVYLANPFVSPFLNTEDSKDSFGFSNPDAPFLTLLLPLPNDATLTPLLGVKGLGMGASHPKALGVVNEGGVEDGKVIVKQLGKAKDYKNDQVNLFQSKNQNTNLDNDKLVLPLNLTCLLNALQLSLYYHEIIKLSSFNLSLKKNFSPYSDKIKNKEKGNQSITQLAPILKQIVKKLPIHLFIIYSIEQRVHKQVLIIAIKKAWFKIAKKAYTKAILKLLFLSLESKDKTKTKDGKDRDQGTDETNLTLSFIKLYSKYNQKLEKIEDIFKNKQEFIQKIFSKQRMPKFIRTLNTIKVVYQNHVLYALKNLKQPILSTKYSIQLNFNKYLIIDQLSDEISNYLLYKTEDLINNLTIQFLKPLLFVKYIEQLKSSYLFSGSQVKLDSSYNKKKETNQNSYKKKEAVNLKTIFQIYLNNLNSNNFSTLKSFFKTNSLIGNNTKYPVSFKTSFIKKLDLNKQKKRKKSSSQKYRLFNNIYTLSHRERWDADKDWQVFLLYNSVISESNDLPIFAYKNRLFSTSMSSWTKYSSTISENSLQKKEDLQLSNAFYSGPGIIKHLLDEFNFAEIQKLDKQNRLLLYQLNKQILKFKKQLQIFLYDKTIQTELKDFCKKRDLLIRRTKLVRKLFRKDSNPSSMILTVLPVLPPDLRPIVKMGGQIAASDLNRLYQRVIYRNDRLRKFLKDPATSHSYEMKYAQRLLQEAVDNLLQNGKSGMNSEKDSRGRALKSLSDNLKGKQGRFRQFLLGKRVDYSGRTVIVVGPKLKLHECGIPVEMAKELYLPFLLKTILNKNYAKTVVGAKTLMKTNPYLVQELLREIMQISPVLLNRAPTLHRLGIQAFVPKLIEGRAILLHPLVCSAFNADFDGDQMAVHVPITIEARSEAWKLMLSRNNILSPATGDPLAIPSQDMVLGCYYLTTYSNLGSLRLLQGSGFIFHNFQDVMKAYQHHKIETHALVWVKWNGLVENGMDQEEPLEIRLSNDGNWHEISTNYYRIYDSQNLLINQYMVTTPGRIILNLLIRQII